jgi:hypothetical protein
MSLSFDTVSVLSHENPKYTLDDQGDRIVFSFPFVDSMDVYRGTSLFSVSVRALADKLVAEGRLKVNEDVSVVSPGILLGSPDLSKENIFNKVSSVWNNGKQGRVILDAEDSGVSFSLISIKTDHGLFFGHLVNDSIFSISDSMKLIICLSMFLTFYLTLFFIVSFKPNPVTVVKNRITRLRENLFEQLYLNKSTNERAKWMLELEQRRDEIRSELKSNIKLNRRTEKNIDGIIDKSLDELLAVIKYGITSALPVTTKKTQLNKAEEIEEVKEPVDVEELEKIEEPDEVEELCAINEEEEIEELEEAEESTTVSKIKNSDDEPQKKRGLLALATEIGLKHEFAVVVDEPETESEPINAELDIVSPFDSMFSSLDENIPEPEK